MPKDMQLGPRTVAFLTRPWKALSRKAGEGGDYGSVAHSHQQNLSDQVRNDKGAKRVALRGHRPGLRTGLNA